MKAIHYLLFFILIFSSCDEENNYVVYIDDLKGSCNKVIKIGNSSGLSLDSECLKGKKIRYLEGKLLNGDMYDINKSKSKYKVVNLWFSQCKPCIAEIPGLNKLVDEFSSKVDFISVCRNSLEDDMHIIDKYNFSFNHLINGNEKISEWFPESGFPTTYVLNKNNAIIKVIVGGKVDSTAPIEIYDKISKEFIFN